jgi:phosphate transport system ATP-binding protein
VASSSACASRVASLIKPEVLLLDEPCSALDPISTAKIEELIDDLKVRLHGGDRHPQHAAGSAVLRLHGLHVPRRADRVRQDTDLFMKPSKKQTEDYITGRFG